MTRSWSLRLAPRFLSGHSLGPLRARRRGARSSATGEHLPLRSASTYLHAMHRRLAFALCLAACSAGSAHRDGGLGPDGAVGPDGGSTVDAGADAGTGPSATVHYLGRFDFSDPAGARSAWPG